MTDMLPEVVAALSAIAALVMGGGMIVFGVIAHRASGEQIDRLIGHMEIKTELAEYRAKLEEAHRANARLQRTVEDERRARAAVQKALDDAIQQMADSRDVDGLVDAINAGLRDIPTGVPHMPRADSRAPTEDARGHRDVPRPPSARRLITTPDPQDR
jgi:hypothetical protein